MTIKLRILQGSMLIESLILSLALITVYIYDFGQSPSNSANPIVILPFFLFISKSKSLF